MQATNLPCVAGGVVKVFSDAAAEAAEHKEGIVVVSLAASRARCATVGHGSRAARGRGPGEIAEGTPEQTLSSARLLSAARPATGELSGSSVRAGAVFEVQDNAQGGGAGHDEDGGPAETTPGGDALHRGRAGVDIQPFVSAP